MIHDAMSISREVIYAYTKVIEQNISQMFIRSQIMFSQ